MTTKTTFSLNKNNFWTTAYLVVGLCFVLAGATILGGCSDHSSRPRSTAGAGKRRNTDSAFLIGSVSNSLNNLPSEIVLDLAPPKPILDDAKSADRQPVMAVLTATPAVPDGPINFISVPRGNANFRKIGVRPGDKVRYFGKYDEDNLEHGIEQTDYFPLTVRRLDTFNPDNALIIEESFNFPDTFPKRIEIWRISSTRMREIDDRIKKPRKKIDWEPSADEKALTELAERTNQWLRNLTDKQSDWQLEEKVYQLPENIRRSKRIIKLLSKDSLASGQFVEQEARQLQQAIWLRDISRWAKGEAVSPLDVANNLFDWTIRNVQLDADANRLIENAHQPWQVLMYGHGTAQQRAWVFAELCRQQQLDVVMLMVGDRWWLPALLEDEQLYLFDARLGLPITNPDDSSVVTLNEVKANTKLLRQLDLDDEKYPVTAEDLDQVTARLVASPLQLSNRAILLQQALEGDDYVELSADTKRVAEGVTQATKIEDVPLWPYPYQAILDEASVEGSVQARAAEYFRIFAEIPRLWKARVLHFQGRKDIPIEDRNDPLAQPDKGHQRAIALYQHRRVRPSNRQINSLVPAKRLLYGLSKANASYWVGLLSYDLRRYRVAKDWFEKRTLEAAPNGPWTQGARYNLARTHEALGELNAAIKLLEADDSPQRVGNLLRAKQLQAKLRAYPRTNMEGASGPARPKHPAVLGRAVKPADQQDEP